MKKAFIVIAYLATMMAAGTGLKAQEVTIPLLPGWTWISYPAAVPVDIATAFGSFTPLEGDVIESQFGMVSYVDGGWLGDFDQFYPGYGYMYYSTRMVPVTVTFNAQQPTQQVVVTTDTPQFITGNSAMGGGEVTTNDGTYILVKGLCWATHENPTTNDDFYQEAESGVGSFSISMTGLNIATTYYVRAYAVTPNGTVYGDQQTFTTRDGIPTVTTDTVTSITGATASCGGTVTDNGGLNVTARGVCWSTSQNPTLSDSHTTDGSGLGDFTSSITGLSLSTTYYVRAYATTSAGTGYGEQVSFTTRNGIPTVTTVEVTSIGSAWAYSGGNITDDGGLAITERGVCWSLSPSPTLANSHTINGSGAGSFSSYMTGLSMSTTYYVRAYATNSFVTVYGNQLSFTTADDYVYVDLGLPSGTLWATCNIGASGPEEYGDYFAWGETQPKDYYDWSNYQHCNGNGNSLTKYCSDSSYGYNGFTDNLTTLLPEDDVATVNWGSDWRTPTLEEWLELYYNITFEWTNQNGVNGLLFTASNGNSLFIPSAGHFDGSTLVGVGDYSSCWSSSIQTSVPSSAYFYFTYSGGVISTFRYLGFSVRPVRSSQPSIQDYSITITSSPTEGGTLSGGGIYQQGQSCTVIATANAGYTFANWTENGIVVSSDASYSFIVSENRTLVANFTYIGGSNHEYVDLGLPSGLLWATCNVGADSSEDYGDYFAWGETQTKNTYNWSTYQYCNGNSSTLTKYCNNSNYGYYGFTDNLTTLLPEDDAATANWGSDWRMPTKEEWQELYNNTTCTWITQNGVNGKLFTASNGNSLFLPAAGWYFNSSLNNSYGSYWSSSLDTDSPDKAWYFHFTSGGCYMLHNNRGYGRSVRAVRSSQSGTTNCTITVTPSPTDGGTVTGDGIYQQGQSCTVTATANTGYTFVNWTESGNVVSTNANHTFTVTGNRTLVAQFQTSTTVPTVTTAQVTNIQRTTAIGGGNVTDSGGSTVSERGICWSTSHNPTTSGSHASSGMGTGSFTVSMTGLTINTTYYVRAYAINNVGTAYGNEVSFTTLDHGYVDLGLPSGTLWATCNVGADNPEDYGDYFAWGETYLKSAYKWSTYKYYHDSNGSNATLTKYCNDAYYGYNGFTDNLTILLPVDDAATANWGAGWRMPTIEEWHELYNNTTYTWTQQNGVNGMLFTASNGNSLFLPAAGYRYKSSLEDAGSNGYYWSSSLSTANPYWARILLFYSNYCHINGNLRCEGLSVRAVCSSAQN